MDISCSYDRHTWPHSHPLGLKVLYSQLEKDSRRTGRKSVWFWHSEQCSPLWREDPEGSELRSADK